MITILFTDTHFGIKQNSITWLNSQMDFIDEQLIPYIKDNKEVRLIHLGDVFDSRSSISTLVATRVVDKFRELASLVKEFIIIGGNHDYYSPSSCQIDTLNLLLCSIDNLRLVTKDIYIDNDELFVPWYSWLDQQHVKEIISTNNIKRIYTHADIVSQGINFDGVDVYSGHIHTPYIKNRIKNLGSCYFLNFNDSNSIRGFYVIDGGNMKLIENETSIKFHRLYNDDVFCDLSHIKQNDYIEIYISQSNLAKEKFVKVTNEISNKYKNVWIIPQMVSQESLDIEFAQYNVGETTKKFIPDHLKDKFNMVMEKINKI